MVITGASFSFCRFWLPLERTPTSAPGGGGVGWPPPHYSAGANHGMGTLEWGA